MKLLANLVAASEKRRAGNTSMGVRYDWQDVGICRTPAVSDQPHRVCNVPHLLSEVWYLISDTRHLSH